VVHLDFIVFASFDLRINLLLLLLLNLNYKLKPQLNTIILSSDEDGGSAPQNNIHNEKWGNNNNIKN
jgi:hypothetical protein